MKWPKVSVKRRFKCFVVVVVVVVVVGVVEKSIMIKKKENPMLVVRAIKPTDTDAVLALAAQVVGGMTTLKADRTLLAQRIELACASFAEQIDIAQRDYLFVMEDMTTQQVVGICGIKSAVGLDAPFYNYRLGTQVHACKELNVFSRMETLSLSNDLMGSAELCSLFLHPAYRHSGNGRLLSKSRLLFIAQFPHLFPEWVIAEMRGVLNKDGNSPFWEHVGRHFFKMEFRDADELCTIGKKSFIAELMPRYPLYVAYLPPEAQQVIGQVHADTAPARRLLEQEGMRYSGYVDIFDAGAVLQARVSELRAVRESRLVRLATMDDVRIEGQQKQRLLIANTRLSDFRVTMINLDKEIYKHSVVAAEYANALHCLGDELRLIED